MKKLSKELKIALVAIAGIVILFFGMNFLKGITVFSNDSTYYITFSDVNGLSSSSPIFADGYQVGIVKEILYDYQNNGNILVKFGVNKDLRIPLGTTAEIESDFMGNVRMNLLMANNPRERVNPGDTISGMLNAGTLAKAAEMLPAIEKMLPKLDSILTSINAIMANPAIMQTLNNAQLITNDLTMSTKQLNGILAQLNSNMPQLLGKAHSVLDNTSQLTSNLAAVDLANTMARVDQTISNMQEITARINNNEGSLGLLINDKGLYNNLNSTLSSADSLLVNLRAHPKRYVHFSLFGKKDK